MVKKKQIKQAKKTNQQANELHKQKDSAGTVVAKSEIEQAAERLNQQVMSLIKQGRFTEAVPIAQKALEIRERALGAEHPDTATSLNNLARNRW